MLIKRLFYIGLLPALIPGCSYYSFVMGKQPAPVYEGHAQAYQVPAPPTPAKAATSESAADIEIHELKDSSAGLITPIVLQPEPLSPQPLPVEQVQSPLLTPEQEKELADLQKFPGQTVTTTAPGTEQAVVTPPPGGTEPTDAAAPAITGSAETNPPPSSALPEQQPPEANAPPPAPPSGDNGQASAPATESSAPSNPSLGQPTEPEVALTPPPPPPPPPFEPLNTFAPLSPVVGTLVLAANKSADKGNVESATSTIERAMRIEPRNPTLFYKLAVLRLKQNKPRLAEDLAKKSALLATNDKALKKHSWLLIARARDMQNDPDGAKEARKTADKF